MGDPLCPAPDTACVAVDTTDDVAFAGCCCCCCPCAPTVPCVVWFTAAVEAAALPVAAGAAASDAPTGFSCWTAAALLTAELLSAAAVVVGGTTTVVGATAAGRCCFSGAAAVLVLDVAVAVDVGWLPAAATDGLAAGPWVGDCAVNCTCGNVAILCTIGMLAVGLPGAAAAAAADFWSGCGCCSAIIWSRLVLFVAGLFCAWGPALDLLPVLFV